MIAPFRKNQELLDDIVAHHDAPGVHLWWLGQSGFALAADGQVALLDPYLSDSLTRKYDGTDKPHVRMTELAIPPRMLAPVLSVVTSTHQHSDHLDADTLGPMLEVSPHIRVLAPEACLDLAAERSGLARERLIAMDDGRVAELGAFDIRAIPSAHEQVEHDERGRCRYLGYVIRAAGVTIYHSGDTVRYDGMAEKLAACRVDVALLPINGRLPERRVPGNLTGPEAAQLARDMGARIAIPHHYEMFEFNTESPDAFVDECRRIGQPFRLLRCGERLDFPEPGA
jgi:L-ascorbate metabolism protein UlaG (beta-lactamase superfamily)